MDKLLQGCDRGYREPSPVSPLGAGSYPPNIVCGPLSNIATMNNGNGPEFVLITKVIHIETLKYEIAKEKFVS